MPGMVVKKRLYLQSKVCVIGQHRVGKHTMTASFVKGHLERFYVPDTVTSTPVDPTQKAPIQMWTVARPYDFPQGRRVRISAQVWVLDPESNAQLLQTVPILR